VTRYSPAAKIRRLAAASQAGGALRLDTRTCNCAYGTIKFSQIVPVLRNTHRYVLDLLYCNSKTEKMQELLMIKILPALDKDLP